MQSVNNSLIVDNIVYVEFILKNKGIMGDNINVMLAAASMNYKRVMNLWRAEVM